LSCRSQKKKELTLQVTDKLSNDKRVDIDLAKLTISISGNGKSITPKVSHKSLGLYTCDFTPKTAVKYQSVVSYVKSEVVKQSIVCFDNPDAKCCGVTEIPTKIALNKSYEIKVTSKDKQGQPIGVGGDMWEVGLVGKAKANVELSDNGDGNYVFKFSVTVPGEYNLRIMNSSKVHVTGSPCVIIAV